MRTEPWARPIGFLPSVLSAQDRVTHVPFFKDFRKGPALWTIDLEGRHFYRWAFATTQWNVFICLKGAL